MRLDCVADVVPVFFCAQKQDADKEQAHDDARGSQHEQKFAPFAVDQVMPTMVIRKFKKVNST